MGMIKDDELLELGDIGHSHSLKAQRFPRSHVANFSFVWANKSVKHGDNRHCHASLSKRNWYDAPLKDVEVISNVVQTTYKDEKDYEHYSKEVTKEYYKYLFNESPFAPCYVTKDLDLALKSGITVRTTQPANLVAAACIATRQAWEYPFISRTFVYLSEQGLCPRKAHLAAHLIIADGKFLKNCTTTHHVAVHPFYMTSTGVNNFLSSKLVECVRDKDGVHNLNKVHWKEHPDYYRLDSMWGPPDGSFVINVQKKREPTFSDPFGIIKVVAEKGGRSSLIDTIEEAFTNVEE